MKLADVGKIIKPNKNEKTFYSISSNYKYYVIDLKLQKNY